MSKLTCGNMRMKSMMIFWCIAGVLILFCMGCKKISGCINTAAYNYNPDANVDDGSCCFIYNDTLDIPRVIYSPNTDSAALFSFTDVMANFDPQNCGQDGGYVKLDIQNVNPQHYKLNIVYHGYFANATDSFSFEGQVLGLEYGSIQKKGYLYESFADMSTGNIVIDVDSLSLQP